MSLFRSFNNDVPIVGKEPTKDEMAAELAEETCLRYKEIRAEAVRREQACEEPLPDSPVAKECIETIEALMKGRHRWIVVPIILEHFPELVTPAGDLKEPT